MEKGRKREREREREREGGREKRMYALIYQNPYVRACQCSFGKGRKYR
jgi:hypothetical protein